MHIYIKQRYYWIQLEVQDTEEGDGWAEHLEVAGFAKSRDQQED